LDEGYISPIEIPINTEGKKKHVTNAKALNTLLGSLSQLEFVKIHAAQISQRNMGQIRSELRRRLPGKTC